MGKRRLRITALLLAAVMLLSGCSLDGYLAELRDMVSYYDMVPYENMEYSRPSMSQLQKQLEESCDTIMQAKKLAEAEQAIYAFYDAYDRFYTDYNLADLHYCKDLTDIYWEKEYNFCAENAPAADAALEELYCAIADSPHREAFEGEDYFGAGYFDAYEGEESHWDEAFLALLEQEAQLQSEYYDQSDQAMNAEYYSEEYFRVYGIQMEELFVELVKLRQEIAAYAGYSSYPEFAYDYYYYRDYTPSQAENYLLQVGEVLYDIYYHVNLSDPWSDSYAYCSEAQTFAYVKEAAEAMGGIPKDAFTLLEEAGLCDISYGENKYNSSFEVYLWSYYAPFIFMNPYLDQTDKLTFAHEFGHFANDYACNGSYAGTDIAEVHSQAFEYLSLCYCQDTQALTAYKMADSLCTYMEQAAYALFEQQVYGLVGEELTVENVEKLYRNIGTEFGLDSWGWDSRDYVTVTHFYTNPMYVVSYVVSNDLAMQIYQLELGEKGAGLSLYDQCLYSQDSYIMTFAEDYGLESPFAEGRLEAVLEIFQRELA